MSEHDQAQLTSKRDRFDIPDDITYLNCAFMGPLPTEVVQAGQAGLATKARPWTIDPPAFFSEVEELRGAFASIVGGDLDGVAMLPSVSYGITTAAANLPIEPDHQIVVAAEQFPSNVYPWREAAARVGATITTVPRPEDHDWTRAVVAAVSDSVDVVAIPHCHWTDGGLIDLEAVGEAVRAHGAALVIDGTQSIGAMPFDVERIQPDFCVVALYKWLLGPYSTACMWVAPQHRGGSPLEHGWMSRKGAEDFAGLVDYTDVLAEGARRFDVGQTSNFALVPAARVALELNIEWGADRISTYTANLTRAIASGARELGLQTAPEHFRAPHMIGVHLGDAAEAAAAALREQSIFVSVRGDAMRISPHVYNDLGDVERLLAILKTSM